MIYELDTHTYVSRGYKSYGSTDVYVRDTQYVVVRDVSKNLLGKTKCFNELWKDLASKQSKYMGRESIYLLNNED